MNNTNQQIQRNQLKNYAPKPGVSQGPRPVTKVVAKVETSFSVNKTERELLRYVLEMKFLSLDQIERKFGGADSEVRIKALVNAGYLKMNDGVLNRTSLLVATMKVYDLLKAENPKKELAEPLKRVFAPSVNHDLKLAELRMRFEELNFIEKWFSEKMLEAVPLMKRSFRDLPDAVCRKVNQKSYFLELEISGKSGKAYAERITEYQRVLGTKEIQEAGIEGVIFLCTDPDVADVIRSKVPPEGRVSVLMYSRYIKDETANV